MSTRASLVAAVIGALLLGGAVTGTTRASWVDQAPVPMTGVSSGALAFTATMPAGVGVEKTAGSTATATLTIADTSAGKNLKQRVTATVASAPAGVTATVATACGGSVSYVDTTTGSGNGTFCVRVTSSASAASGNVVINLGGAQRPAGWSTPTVARSVAVTVSSDALTLSCAGPMNPAPRYRLSWNDVDADGYIVYRSSTVNGPWEAVAVTASALQYVEDEWSNNQRSYFVVVPIKDWSAGQTSNVLSVRRSGSSNTFTCGAP